MKALLRQDSIKSLLRHYPLLTLSIFIFFPQVVAALDELAPEFGLPNNERSAHQVPLKEPGKSLKKVSIAP